MLDVLHNSPPAMADDIEMAAGLVAWLDDLLDAARDSGDAALARLIADVMDKVSKAAKG